MAPPLRIPDRYQRGLCALARLPDEQGQALEAALAQMPSRLTTRRLARHVVEGVPELADDARDILDAVLSLSAFLAEGGDAAAAAAVAHDVSTSPDLELDEGARLNMSARLARLLLLEPVAVAARAHDLVTEYERVYHGARVLTDLRPVFGSDLRVGIKAATIVATLKIDAHEGPGPLRSYYFALDQADLLDLQEVIERAVAKTAAMKRLAEQMDLPYWEYEEADDAADS